jgi:hypothetical protein
MIIGFARLGINVPQFTEITQALNSQWLPHFNTNDYQGHWEVLTLRAPGGDADNIFAETLNKGAYADTPNMEQFPSVKALLNDLHCEIMAVRLLNLKAGAIIKQHRDRELSFEKGETRLHFPVITNSLVEFYVNDVRVSMQPGECWYINANLPHRVANLGSTDRVHLVIDCVVNDWLKAAFALADKTTFEEPQDEGQTLEMITMLRSHKTETADKLADELENKLNNKTNRL